MKADSHRSKMDLFRSVVVALVALAPAACGWAEIPANRGMSRGPSDTSARGNAGTPVAAQARPADGTITVASGDSVYAISRRFGVPMQALVDANGLRPPYTLRLGQRLSLPGGGSPGVTAGTAPEIISTTQPTVISTTMPPGDPSAGQPVSSTAATSVSRSGVRVSELPPVTGAAPSQTLSDLPPPLNLPRPAGGALPPPDLADAPTSAPAEELVPAPEAERPEAEQHAALNPKAAVGAPPAATGSGFMWPVNGDVIAEFGPQDKGRHNDGINIAAPRGTPVRAVESGVVAYAGNELRGFGNLLLIKHDGGWVSAYAHNGALLVQRGDTVSRGQEIARVGDSGGVSSPQLHFELRKGQVAVDPRTYIRQPVS